MKHFLCILELSLSILALNNYTPIKGEFKYGEYDNVITLPNLKSH